MKRRLFSVALCMVLLLSLLPGQGSGAVMLNAVQIQDTLCGKWSRTIQSAATGEKVSFEYEVPQGGATVLAFFKTTCPMSQALFESLNEQPWVSGGLVKILALESQGHTVEEIRQFQAEYAPDVAQYIDWYAAGDYGLCSRYQQLAKIYTGGWTWPVVMVCTQEAGVKYIRYADFPVTDGYRLGNSIQQLGIQLGVPQPVSVKLSGEKDYDGAAELAAAVNDYRTEKGLSALRHNAALSELAMLRAAELGLTATQSRPDRSGYQELLTEAFPGFTVCAELEDDWCEDPQDVLSGWRAAYWYDADLTYSGYTQLGAGCFTSGDKTFWVVLLTDDADKLQAASKTGKETCIYEIQTLPEYIADVNFGQQSAAMSVGETQTFRLYAKGNGFHKYPVVTPADWSEQILDTATGETIAQVQVDSWGNFTVTGVAPGTGTLEAKAYSGQQETVKLDVSVAAVPEGEDPPYTVYQILPESVGSGYLGFSETEGRKGLRIYLTVYPEEGHYLSALLLEDADGKYVPTSWLGGDRYSFQMPGSHVTILAVFTPEEIPSTPYRVTQDVSGCGSIRSITNIVEGTPVKVTTAPEEDHGLLEISVTDSQGNNIPMTDNEDGTYTFYMPADHVTVHARFSASSNPVELTWSEGGKASADRETAEPGQWVTVTAEPDYGYALSEYRWSVQPQSVRRDGNQISFMMPYEGTALHLVFVEDKVELSGTIGENIRWKLEGETLTISGVGSMGYIGMAPWQSYGEHILTVIIEDGITDVANQLFQDCSALQSVTIPDSVTSLGESCFRNCDALTQITLPQSLRELGQSAFYDCDGLTGIVIPEGVAVIPYYCFQSCDALTSVSLPQSLAELKLSAFADCVALREIRVPEAVESIWNAFSGCTGLKSIILEGAPGIAEEGFAGVSAQVTVTKGDLRWTEDRTRDYGGSLTWNHSYTASYQDPTCTQPGGTLYTCTCGEEVLEEETPALGHSFGDWVETRPATESLEGERRRTCANCGETEKQSIPKLEPEKPVNPFVDVPNNKYFTEPVLWAVGKGITSGTGNGTTFEPGKTCNRQQIVMFLWRAAGSPEPETLDSPFTDVTVNSSFIKPILWAVEKGITQGTGDGKTFSPKAECTRQQIVMFLWRFYGQPETQATKSPFSDVTSGSSFFKAIMWAVEQGITKGTGDGSQFSPKDPCTRGQIVTFLHRAMGDE